MIYLFIISVALNIISLSKLYLDSSIKKKLQKVTSDHEQLKASYKNLQAEHKQVKKDLEAEYKKLQAENKQLKKDLEASYKSNYKEMMRIYIELKRQGFNDNYILNYICKK